MIMENFEVGFNAIIEQEKIKQEAKEKMFEIKVKTVKERLLKLMEDCKFLEKYGFTIKNKGVCRFLNYTPGTVYLNKYYMNGRGCVIDYEIEINGDNSSYMLQYKPTACGGLKRYYSDLNELFKAIAYDLSNHKAI